MRIEPTHDPGRVIHPEEPVERENDRNRGGDTAASETSISVRNTGSRIVQVGSHYHFFEANPALGFDREAAYGTRLDVPAGDRVYFPPGEVVPVTLVPIGGDRRIRSFYGAVDGRLDDHTPSEALDRLRGRLHEPLAAPPEVSDD